VILAAGLLTSVIFALGGFLNALFAKNFDQVNWIPTFILTPLTYFGGVFYSITLLPPWAQQVSYVNPSCNVTVPLRGSSACRMGFDIGHLLRPRRQQRDGVKYAAEIGERCQ